MMTIQRNQTYNCNSALQPHAQPWVARVDAKPWVPGTLGIDQQNANVAAAAAWERQQLELERRLRQLELEGFNLPTSKGFNPPTTKMPRSERKKERKAKAEEALQQQQLKEQDWHQFCATQTKGECTQVIPNLKQYACLAEGCKTLFGNWTSCVTHMRSECGRGCPIAQTSKGRVSVRRESAAKVNELFLTDPEFMIVNIGSKGVRGFESEEAAYEYWLNGLRSRNRRYGLAEDSDSLQLYMNFEGFVSTFLDGKTKDDTGSWYSTRHLRKEVATSGKEDQLNHITLDAWKAQQQAS